MKKWKKKLSVYGSLEDKIGLHDPTVLFLKKRSKVKIEKNNKVYGGLSIMLVHHRHLGLKLTDMDLFDKRR
jgi:hypothetical protein